MAAINHFGSDGRNEDWSKAVERMLVTAKQLILVNYVRYTSWKDGSNEIGSGMEFHVVCNRQHEPISIIHYGLN